MLMILRRLLVKTIQFAIRCWTVVSSNSNWKMWQLPDAGQASMASVGARVKTIVTSPRLIAASELAMLSWNRWKYPVLITLLFAVFHSMSVLYEGPSPVVSLPADLRQLLEQRIVLRGRYLPSLLKDRQTNKFKDGLFSLGAKTSQNILPEEMEELLEEYDDEEEENEGDDDLHSNKTKLPSDSRRRSKKKKGKHEQLAADKEESEMEKQSRQLINELQKREIVGNERFLGGKYSMGIQRPEEFYERNRRDRQAVHSAVTKSPTNHSLQQPISTLATTTVIKPDMSTTEPSKRKSTIVRAIERRSVLQGQNRTLNAGDGDVKREIRNTSAIKPSSKDFGGDRTSKNGVLEIDSDVAEYREFLRRKYGKALEIPSNSSSIGAVQPLPFDSASAVSKSPQKLDSVTKEPSLNQPKLTKRKRKRKRKQKATNGTTLETLMKLPYPPVVVNTEKLGFLDRVLAYNKAISDVRDKIFKVRGYRVWKDVANASELTVIWGNEDDFLERLAEHPGVTTILLPWINYNNESTESAGHGNSGGGGGGDWSRWSSVGDKSNVLVNEYYEWTAAEQLCEWIRTPGFTKAHWDAVYNTQCNEDPNRAIRPQSLEFMYLYGKPINRLHYWPNEGLSYPEYFYRRPPPYVFYVQLLEDSIVNAVGDVISGRLKLVPYTCSHDNLPTIPAEYPDRPVYRELFVITQFWGSSFFHKLLEVMPRIAPYVDFLRSNTGVQIHAPEDRSQVSEMFRILGINPERIVTGIARAKLVYLPQGTPCGFPDAREIQLLSHRFRNYIRSSLLSADELRHRLLLMVRRSGMRRFVHQTPIEYALQKLAERYGLNFTVFPDNPTPPMPVAMRLFNAAAVVVGPHGAGLSNVIFSEPGTVVVEGVCNEPHVNMCYQFTAHSLGLRYHSLPSQRGCESIVDVLPETIEETVEFYLKMIVSGDETKKNS